MANKKLIAIDLDGTLLFGKSQISEKSIEVLRRLSKQGHIIVLSSGRPYRCMMPFYELLECTGPIICYNGGLVFDPKNPKFPAISRLFDKNMLQEIAIKTKGIVTSFMAEDLEDIYISRWDNHLKKYFTYEDMKIHEGDMSKIIQKDTYTALFRCTHAHDEELKQITESYDGIEFRHWTGSFYSELAFKGCDKGNALRYIKDYYGFSKEDVIAFGDAVNDFSMLDEAGFPFAMKGCKSKKLAESFPNTKKGNAQSGVALMLEELLG